MIKSRNDGATIERLRSKELLKCQYLDNSSYSFFSTKLEHLRLILGSEFMVQVQLSPRAFTEERKLMEAGYPLLQIDMTGGSEKSKFPRLEIKNRR